MNKRDYESSLAVLRELSAETVLDAEKLQDLINRFKAAKRREYKSSHERYERAVEKAVIDMASAVVGHDEAMSLAARFLGRALRYIPVKMSTKLSTEKSTNLSTNPKEREAERGNSPHTPLKEKGEGKEKTLALAGESRAHACVGWEVPELGTVVAVAQQIGVKPWYARWWWRTMERSGWTTSHGERVMNLNWRPKLLAWWRRQDKKELDAAWDEEERRVASLKPVIKADDWTLCRERCANCGPNGCLRGIAIPPDRRRDDPRPPSDCPRFAALPEEGGAGCL